MTRKVLTPKQMIPLLKKAIRLLKKKPEPKIFAFNRYWTIKEFKDYMIKTKNHLKN